MRRTAFIAITALALSGCASLGSTAATGAPPSSGAPSSAPSAAAEASSAPCTTKKCIAQDLDENLVGLVAKDVGDYFAYR